MTGSNNNTNHPPCRPSAIAWEAVTVMATVPRRENRRCHAVRSCLKAIACFPVCVLIFGILPAGIYLNLTGLAGVGTPLWYWYAAIVFFGTPITVVAYVTGVFGTKGPGK